MAIVVLSFLIQFFTALYAFRFIRRTGVFYSWLAVSVALLLMGVRRLIPLYRILAGQGGSFDYLMETLGLVLSTLMCFGIVGVGQVFSKTERTRKKVSASLSEKELLLREVNHRIKNNMHTIGVLLRMQAERIGNEEARDSVMDAERRVDRMFRLYDQIYHTDKYLTVRTHDYFIPLLEEIVGSLGGDRPIRTTSDIEDFELDAQTTFYMGIVLNELITNSVKYAFRDVAEPIISLTAKKEDGGATFTVSDNGTGVAATEGERPNVGFGTLLVESLTEQLGGTLEARTERGTTVTLKIPLEPKARRRPSPVRP